MARKKTRKQIKKPAVSKLETRFDCPVCNHENVVQCKIVSATRRGLAFCSICESHHECEITQLDKPVDVYHHWIDSMNVKESSKKEQKASQ